MTEPASLIRSAKWPQGAWTPARCALWHRLQGEDRGRLEKWVATEHTLGLDEDGKPKTHSHQIPKQFRDTSAG